MGNHGNKGRFRLALPRADDYDNPAEIEDITWPRGDTKFLFEC